MHKTNENRRREHMIGMIQCALVGGLTIFSFAGSYV